MHRVVGPDNRLRLHRRGGTGEQERLVKRGETSGGRTYRGVHEKSTSPSELEKALAASIASKHGVLKD